MTSIAEKYAQQYQPNGEVSLADLIQAALDEQAETHALELRAYEATVQNLEGRIAQMEKERVPSLYILTDLIADGLRGTYHCTRVWSAWGIGTMSEDDFSPVEESGTPAEIAESIISLIAAAPAQEKV